MHVTLTWSALLCPYSEATQKRNTSGNFKSIMKWTGSSEFSTAENEHAIAQNDMKPGIMRNSKANKLWSM